MLFLKIGPDLVNVGNITWIRMLSRETDELAVHFVGGGEPWVTDSDTGNALLEELVMMHDSRLLVLRRREFANQATELAQGREPDRVGPVHETGGNGHVRTQTQHDPAPAGDPRQHDPQGGGAAGPRGGLQGDEPAAGPEPLFAPQRRPDPGERPRRRRAGARTGAGAA